jgi:hypothetical protein
MPRRNELLLAHDMLWAMPMTQHWQRTPIDRLDDIPLLNITHKQQAVTITRSEIKTQSNKHSTVRSWESQTT